MEKYAVEDEFKRQENVLKATARRVAMPLQHNLEGLELDSNAFEVLPVKDDERLLFAFAEPWPPRNFASFRHFFHNAPSVWSNGSHGID